MRLALVFGYIAAFILPTIALISVFIRARSKHRKYAANVEKRQTIDEEYAPEIDRLQARIDAREPVGDSELDLYKQLDLVKKKKQDRYAEEGVTYMSYDRLQRELEEVFEGKPRDAYTLATQDIWLIGLGLLVGSTTSIASLFV